MNNQLNSSTEAQADHVALRDLLESEIVLIGGGEVVISGL